MTDLENVNHLLDEMKISPVADIGKYFSPAIRQFRFLPRPQRLECAQTFHQWASEHAASEPLKLGYAEFLLGMHHFIIEEHEESFRWLTEAHKTFEEMNDSEGQGLCSMLIGAIYRTFCNFDLALKVLWEAFHLLKKSGRYPTFLAATANSLANINLELHNYDEALAMFKITFEESEKEHDFYFNIYALHGMGKVSLLQKNFNKAREDFEKALALAEQNNHPLQIANSLTELGNLYCSLNEHEKAVELNLRALDIRLQNNMTGGAITNCIHLGEVYILLSKWEDALRILNEGLAKAEQLKVKPKMYQVHLLLSQIYEKTGELEKSLHHYKLFHHLRAQVEEEDSARKLADAKLVFEAEQVKKENIIIKRQKAEIQKKNIQLQETIDELTLSRVSRKAKALTLVIAIVLFIGEDFILGFVLRNLPYNNYFISLAVKMIIIFSLSPINGAIEHYLLKQVIKKKKREEDLISTEEEMPLA